MSIFSLILYKNKTPVKRKFTLLLIRMNCIILYIKLFITNNCQGFKNNRLILPLNYRSFHIFRSIKSIYLSSLSSFSFWIILIELLFEFKVFFLENISNFCICMEFTLMILKLLQTAVNLCTVIMHEYIL